MTETLDPVRRHPFTDSTIGVPLSDKLKGFNWECYDGTTDPDKHMDTYTTHMSLYTSNMNTGVHFRDTVCHQPYINIYIPLTTYIFINIYSTNNFIFTYIFN